MSDGDPKKNGKDVFQSHGADKSESDGSNLATDKESHEAMSLVDSFHPLYLHASDNATSCNVSKKLTGQDNYAKWSKVIHFLLRGRNKLGFINGTCVKSKYSPIYHDLWDRCDTVVLGWIFNSVSDEIGDTIMYMDSAFAAWKDLKQRFDKVDGSRKYQLHREIILTTQGIGSISKFFTRLRHLWAEYDSVCALPYIGGEKFQKYIDHNEEQKLFQFLNGLNETYTNVRSTLLLRDPLPLVNTAYNMLIQEESQRGLSSNIAEASANNTSIIAERLKNQNLECTFCHKKGHLAERCFSKGCEYCKKKGHVKDMCFKYKESLKPKSNLSKVSGSNDGSSGSGQTSTAEPNHNVDASGGIHFTKEQFEVFMKSITQPGSSSSTAGAAAVKDAPSCSNGPLKWEGLGDWK